MTAASTLESKSVQAPPEPTRETHIPMCTQRRPVRVVYAVAPDVFACAAQTEAYRALVRAGAGLAVKVAVGAAAVGSAGDGGECGDGADGAVGVAFTAAAAMSGHSRSYK